MIIPENEEMETTGAPEEEAGEEGTPAPEENAGEEANTGEASAETENTGETEPAKKSKFVPYDRFQEVNSRMKTAESMANSQQAVINNLQTQINELKSGTEGKPENGKKPVFSNPQEQAVYDKYVAPMVVKLEGQIQTVKEETAIWRQQQAIEKELVVLKTKYPEMERSEVIMGYLNDLDTPLVKHAEKSHASRVKIKQDAIKEYRSSKEKTSQHQGSSPEGSSPTAGTGKPPASLKTFDQKLKFATKAAIQRLSAK